MTENEQKKIAPNSSTSIDVEQSQISINDIIPNNTQNSKKKLSQNEYILQCITNEMQQNSAIYPRNDIGASRLFYKCFQNHIVYVLETKCWYIYNGSIWVKDDGNLRIMELMKKFVLQFTTYAINSDEEELIKFSTRICNRSRRESIIKDATSIFPKSFSDFDSKNYLFNCKNGTYNLKTNELQPHSPTDYITKISKVNYDITAKCERWNKFISEIMQENKENELFLQKCFGYALSGDTNLECFFIFYGSTTRNGKSTTCETVSYVFGDYATNAQAKTVAKNKRDGSSATPDIARLKGARFVTMAEPEKGLEIDVSLIKQLTGGDRYTGRFLNENPTEFVPEFKIFINTNHLPRVNDDTIFSSERVKILPFERHFNPEEQDTGLKEKFKSPEMASGILNWLIDGYNLLKFEGLATPQSVLHATTDYRNDSDTFGAFIDETIVRVEGARFSNTKLYNIYKEWSKDNGFHSLNSTNYALEMQKRGYVIKRNGKRGKEVLDIDTTFPW